MLDNDAIETGSQCYIRARAVLFRWKEHSCLWTNYAVAPIFQHSLINCADCSVFGMLRKASWTFINLPWLESSPVHNLPSFPPPAYRASLLLKLVDPWTKVVKHKKKKVEWQAIKWAIHFTVAGTGWCWEHLLTWKTDKEVPLSEWPLPGFAHPGSNPKKNDINNEDKLKTKSEIRSLSIKDSR